jgi:hypothetical protein
MEKIAVFVDDAEHAKQLLAPMLAQGAHPVRWVIVACPPRLTHRIGKWVSNAGREQFRERWARTLRDRLEPTLARAPIGGGPDWLVAGGPLDRFADGLRARFGTDLRVLDARRPKLGVDLPPLVGGAKPATPGRRWATPIAVSSSLSVMLALTD